jgi:hypothetical protein
MAAETFVAGRLGSPDQSGSASNSDIPYVMFLSHGEFL